MTPATPARTLPSTRLRRGELSSVIGRRSVLRAPDGNPHGAVAQRDLFATVCALQRRVRCQRQLIRQQLCREPIPIPLQALDDARVAAHRRRDPIADLVAGRLTQALEPMPYLARQAL